MINVHNENGKLRRIILDLLKTKKDIKKSKGLIKILSNSITKYNLIMQLKTEFNYIKNLNENYINYVNIVKKLTKVQKNNKEHVENLSIYLKTHFSDYIKIIDKYDNKISMCKEDKKTIISINDGIIEMKRRYEKTLKEKLYQLENQIQEENKEISAQKIKIEELKLQKINEKEKFLEKERLQKKQYEILKNKYYVMKKTEKLFNSKIKEFDIALNEKSIEIENVDLANKMLEKENKNVELSEQEIKNQNLNDKIKYLQNKIIQLSSSNLFEDNRIYNSQSNINLTNHKITPIISLKLNRKCFSPINKKKLSFRV